MTRRVARVKWELLLTVGEQEFQCSDFEWSFSLNQIPVAKATLAVGRSVRTLQRANVHTEAGASALTNMSPATVTLIPSGHWSPRDVEKFAAGKGLWDSVEPQVIFDGYLTGVGHRKIRGNLQYTVSLIHWLSDLHFSSALSNQSHPGNPARFRWRASFQPSGKRTDAINASSYFASSHSALTRFTAHNIQQDFWGRSLQQLYCDLSEHDLLDMFSAPTQHPGCSGWQQPNTQSQDALKRIECNLKSNPVPLPDGRPRGENDFVLVDGPPLPHATEEDVGEDCHAGSKSKFHVPLRLRSGPIPAIVANAVGRWCTKQSLESYFSSTLWDKIVGFIAPQFEFAIVPKIRTAQVIPFCPGLRHTYDVELNLNDLISMDMQSHIPRPLRAVGVTSSAIISHSHAMNDVAPMAHVGGCYAPDPNGRGMVKFVKPPYWLSALPAQSPSPVDTAQGLGGLETKPGEADGGAAAEHSVMAAYNSLHDYYGRYAHATYVREMLRGRWGVVSGKVRFDIAPGTTVAIKNKDPLHIPGDAQTQNLVGEVVRVAGKLSAEARKGSTSFQIAYLRTEGENTQDATSTDSHPLYEEHFGGAPLLQAYKFE